MEYRSRTGRFLRSLAVRDCTAHILSILVFLDLSAPQPHAQQRTEKRQRRVDVNNMLPTDTEKMEAEEPPPGGGKASRITTHDNGPPSPSQPLQAGRPIKTSKCAFCRKDHKKVRSSSITLVVIDDSRF